MNNWEKTTLGKAVLFNPTERIVKGAIAKKIAMDKIQSFTRMISGYELTEFSGGSKFRNGDTLLARITPCLENGKTAQVTILDDDEIGFGSTEYIVLREKENITDNNYIYYFSLNPSFRNVAIQSMVGSTGRQRVQQNVLENLEINLPPLDEQKRIADVLSALDDKIEVNNKINENLEAQAQAIFKQWFVDFEFPDAEGKPYKSNGGKFIDSELGKIPVGWRVGKLGEIAEITSGKRPKIKIEKSTDDVNIPLIGASCIMGYTDSFLYNKPIIVTGRVGTHGIIQRFNKPCYPSDNTLVLTTDNYEYTYQILKTIDFKSLNIGSTQPLITQTHLKNINVVIPNENLIKHFETINSTLFNKYEINIDQNKNLSEIRDSLLPKLMNGEVRV